MKTGRLDFLSIDMIIDLTINIKDLERIPEFELSDFVNKIVSSSYDGNHLVIIPRDVSEWICNNVPLSKNLLGHTKKIGQKFPQYASLKKKSQAILEVEFDGDLEPIESGTKWRIGYKALVEGNYLQKTVVIVENIKNDRKLYDVIFKLSENKFTVSGQLSKFSYTFDHGGGSTTPDLFEYLVKDERRIVVCICDTDFLVPDSAPDTSNFDLTKSREVEILKQTQVLGMVADTPGRELENFLSLELVEKAVGNGILKRVGKAKVNKLRELIKNQSDLESKDCLWLFYDVKSGLSYDKIDKACMGDTQKLKWIADKYEMSISDLKKIDYPGFGDVMNKFFDLPNYFHLMQKHADSPYWDLHFADWIDSIVWFFISKRNKNRV